MNSNLGSLNGSTGSDSSQQRTNIELVNPAHPDKDPSYASYDDALRYFQAGTGAKDWPSDRKVLVGEFLCATETLHEEGDSSDLENFISILLGQEVEFTPVDDTDEE